MENELTTRRIIIIEITFIILALTIILKLLMIMLNFSYSINGKLLAPLAIVILGASFYFIYLLNNFFIKIGPSTVTGFQSIFKEWKSYSPLNKLLALSGLLGLPVTLITIGQWFTSFIHGISQR